MDREKQIEEMASDINDCITEFVTDVGDVYIDDEVTAQKMFDKGYRKQSEVAREIFEEIDKQLAFIKKYGYANQTAQIAFDVLAELKKKYTEESGNGR